MRDEEGGPKSAKELAVRHAVNMHKHSILLPTQYRKGRREDIPIKVHASFIHAKSLKINASGTTCGMQDSELVT